jgi:hypothetical protein
MSEPKPPPGFRPVEEPPPPPGFVPVESPLDGIPFAEEPPEPEALEPKSMSGTALRHFSQGGSFSFGDEAGGAMGAADELGRRMRSGLGMKGDESTPVENEKLPLAQALMARFRRERDANRSELSAGERENPKTARIADFVGTVASPNPFGKAKGFVGGLKMGAKLGGLGGLGASNADITKGDVGGATRDTLAGGATGAGMALALSPVGITTDWGSKKLRGMASEVRVDKMGKIEDALDKEIKSAQGARDSATQNASRTGENIQRTTQGVGAMGDAIVSPDVHKKSFLTLSDPRFRKMLDQVAENSVGNIERRTALMESTAAKHDSLVANRDATAAKQFADYFAPGQVMSKEVVPRAKIMATNAAIGLGTGTAAGTVGAAGAMLSGHSGAALPAFGVGMLGGLNTAVGGGTGLKRQLFGTRGLASSPRVQNAALEGLAENGSRAVRAPINALSQQAGAKTAKTLDQRDEEAVQAWLDGT